MSEYSETVRFNLDRLDNEEIAQKIKNNALTDEALEKYAIDDGILY